MSNPIVFDVETKYAFHEVGRDARKLGVSVAAAYDYRTNQLVAYPENKLNQLFHLFEKASLLVGYNSQSFDLVVLSKYYVGDLFKFPHFDLLENIRQLTGRRYPLDDLIQATLNKGKTGHGLQAIDLYRQGKISKLTQYCKDDVQLTKELFDYGINYGFVYLPTATSKVKLVVEWKKIVAEESQKGESQNLTLEF